MSRRFYFNVIDESDANENEDNESPVCELKDQTFDSQCSFQEEDKCEQKRFTANFQIKVRN